MSRTLLVGILLVTASLAVIGVDAQDTQASPTTTFNEQASGGHAVTIDRVSLPVAGFVAIHDATLLEGNVFGSVIGVSAWLDAGEHQDVRVYLTRALRGANETVIAMPHKDTNGNHLYDFVSSQGTQDGPFIGGANAIAEASLPAPLQGKGLGGISAVPRAINNTARVEAMNQTQAGNSLLVEFVDLSQGGFVAVHDATLLENLSANVFSSVVGVSAFLQPGVHHNVVIPLTFNESRTNVTGTLIPMAHKDTDGDRQYGFVRTQGAQDGPYTGQPGTPLTAVIDTPSVTYSDVANETFPAQSTGGHAVVFPEVFVPQGGYAAVHDATLLEGNVLGSVIGVSAFLQPGMHRNVTVELNFNGSRGLNATPANATLIGMLHRETNNNTNYDFVSSQGSADGPYTGGPSSLSESQLPSALQGKGLGGVNAVPAQVTVGAGVRLAASQDTRDGARVIVEFVDLAEPGYVAIHDASILGTGGALKSVVGVSSLLPAGLHRNVTVTLGQGTGNEGVGKLNASQTIIAMPHKETNNNTSYDFVTSNGTADGPFTAPGATNTVTANSIVVAVGFAVAPTGNATGNNTGGAGNGTGGTGNNTGGTGNNTGGTGNNTGGTGNGTGSGNATPTPSPTGSGATPTPSPSPSPSPTGGVRPSPTPSPTPEESGDNDAPGFGLVAALAAVAAALVLLRRRKA